MFYVVFRMLLNGIDGFSQRSETDLGCFLFAACFRLEVGCMSLAGRKGIPVNFAGTPRQVHGSNDLV